MIQAKVGNIFPCLKLAVCQLLLENIPLKHISSFACAS